MIKLEHVSKVYGNGTKGLDDVSLEIQNGEFVAIIGLSGAGKSTLIRTINKMIDITDGSLTVDGVDVSTLKGKSLRKFRRKIGMVFQSFNLVTKVSVINNVLTARAADMSFLRILLGLYKKTDKVKALEALDKVGILDKAYIRADQLSGGQQQRVLLARALCSAKKMILLDEPVTALDPLASSELYSVISELNQKYNIAVIMVSHDIENSVGNASHVLHLRKNGYFFGTSSEYSDSESESKFI